MQNKPKKKVTLVRKPFLRGQPMDSLVKKRALSVMGTIAVSMFIYLVVGSVLVADSFLVRMLLSLLFILMFAGLAYSNGINAGFQDVSFSEIAYTRRESGKPIDAEEEKKCFHPMKGFVSAMIGASPFILLALALAVLTEPQLYQASPLPSWLSGLERRSEIGNPLLFYHEGGAFTVLDVIRILVRLAIMPFVTMADSGNIYAVALVERLSPLFMLVLPSGYGIGYLMGTRARAQVHAGIAANRRKQKKREKKRIQQNRKGPEQLN